MFAARLRHVNNIFAPICFMKNNDFIKCCCTYRRLGGLDRLAIVTLVCLLGGCSGSGSAGGVGTVDISSAKAAAVTSSNPDMAKAASARGKGLTGTAQKTRRK
jgi:hypothetical protein